MSYKHWFLVFFFLLNKEEVLPDECQLRCEVCIEGLSL